MNTRLFITLWALLALPGRSYAQFHTVKKERKLGYEIIKTIPKDTIQNADTLNDTTIIPHPIPLISDSIPSSLSSREENGFCIVRKKHLDITKTYDGLPGLTIKNLIKEIRKNGIHHEKIVLAQAILETGWFTSNVCRTKNNLFGLTNPRTGKYYEFNHWTESVKAYYDKVQYRYKGGNYLLWLDKIGYAEDKVYVASLIRILREYIL